MYWTCSGCWGWQDVAFLGLVLGRSRQTVINPRVDETPGYCPGTKLAWGQFQDIKPNFLRLWQILQGRD